MENILFKCKGIITFPDNITKKHEMQSEWKQTIIIKTNCDIENYYSWFIQKRFNLVLNKTIRGSHLTIVNDKMNPSEFNKFRDIFENKEIIFYYNPIPVTNGEHWWLRVFCPESENIREIMGLNRVPYFNLHLTIGYANNKNIEYSKYIERVCKRYDHLKVIPRMNFNDYKIIDMY